MEEDAVLWVCYPKGGGKAPTALQPAVTFTVGKKYWDTPNAPDDDEAIALMSTDQDLDLLKNLEILDALDVLEAMGSDKGKG